MGARWATVVCAAILMLVHIWGSLRALEAARSSASQRHAGFARRPSALEATMALGWQLIVSAFLAFAYEDRGWDASTVRISTQVAAWAAFLAGIAIYPVFLLVAYVASRSLGHAGQLDHVAFLALRRSWPRRRGARLLMAIAGCVLNPVNEEIIYRGILIGLLGHLLGSYLPAVLAGLVLTLGVHLYQGWRALPFHAIFFAFATLLLFSALGLVGAIGLHFAADLWPDLQTRRRVDLWRQHLRRRPARMAGSQAG
jgi:membrane protease YdiL (CAAX protease family)